MSALVTRRMKRMRGGRTYTFMFSWAQGSRDIDVAFEHCSPHASHPAPVIFTREALIAAAKTYLKHADPDVVRDDWINRRIAS